MIVRLERTWVVLFLAVFLGSKAEVTFENNAYRNVLVSFSPNLTSDNGALLLDSMKVLLENASRVLHKAIGIHIADVTFILPDSWDTSAWDPALSVDGDDLPPASRSAIVVEDTLDSAFGKNPLALQFGGCGVPAQQITVPADFLIGSDDYPKGKLLAREWLKYRYGVFDENGYPGDAMYPSFYTIAGSDADVKVTECTHPEVEYDFRDANGNNCSLAKDSKAGSDDCKIHPGEIGAENVTSSLMYFHEELTNVEQVCGKDHLHNNLGLSKHNILCNEKSVWDILKLSLDFNATAAAVEFASPEYHYAREGKPRVAVLVENTDILYEKENLLIFAVRRLVHDLPEGSKLSLYSFTDEVTTHQALSELTDRSIVPPFSFVTPTNNVCPTCALKVAAEELLQDGSQKQGSIIMIVGSNATEDSELMDKLMGSDLCVTVIVLREADASVDGYSGLLSNPPTCNSIVEISKAEEEAATFDKLYQAMMTSVPQPRTESVTTSVTSGSMSYTDIIEVPAEPMAAKFTLWTSEFLEEKTIICKNGDDVLTLTRLSNAQSNVGTYSLDSPNSAVKCSMQYEKSRKVLAQVQMTSLPGQYFVEDVWIHDTTPKNSQGQQMPIIIYAKLFFGNYPIANAIVTVTVKDPDGAAGDSFNLFDNGKGDPDITKDDGIYSGYFFRFTKVGDYDIIVEMKDDGKMTKTMKNGEDRCCGSQVKSHRHEPVPSFQRTLKTSFHAISARPEDGYAPSKIIDLRATFESNTLLVLQWTAPGGEVDAGKASRYEFKLFCDSDCGEDGNVPDWVSFNNSKQVPKESGEDETARLQFSDSAPMNVTVFIGIEAVRYTKTSGLSNRVQARLITASEIIQLDNYTTPIPPENIREKLNQSLVGTIVAVTIILALVAVCLVGVVWFFVGRSRRKRNEKTETGEDAVGAIITERSDSFKATNFRTGKKSSMRRVESFPVLLYTHDQIKDFKGKDKSKEPPLFKADVAPKPWFSLVELPSSQSNRDGNDDRSVASGSTLRINDYKSDDMKQLIGGSEASVIQAEKVSKF